MDPNASKPFTSLLRGASKLHRRTENPHAVQTAAPAGVLGFLSQELFNRTLYMERKRTERSGRSFVLMLLESTKLLHGGDEQTLGKVLLALAGTTRDTDVKGWYQEGSTVGVIFTELGADAEGRAVANALLSKVTQALAGALPIQQINEIRLSFRVFPENWDKGSLVDDDESGFHEDLQNKVAPKRLPRLIKRSMDIAGSLLALLLSLPLFAGIAVAIKLTSRGTVFFRQTRLGQYGRTFEFLKFRSMYIDNDDSIHQEYVQKFIANSTVVKPGSKDEAAYKLAADPRVTLIGRFLRKTSLDELPQFLNVLKGEMSLVGPRPPVPYEVKCYQLWHKARLLAAKPGITGLWQVTGRSRVKFDDMVRMDLRYANTWSLWLDIKILAQTPLAVLSGSGAH
jgi:lipopolysaccharide/colanic/teichoic acid biosynthesis glycosyltransferase